MSWRLVLVFSMALPGAARLVGQDWQSRLKEYSTPYYVIYSDLDDETVREAIVRMTAMGREYQRRTAAFGRQVRGRLPFYLFSRPEDYHAAGGIRGSVGAYLGDKLLAMADKAKGDRVWRIVQHEGFHQFAHKVISSRLPIWVNEGLAEYFSLGVWTGDAYVFGIVPPARLKQFQKLIREGQMLPFLTMLAMTPRQWTEQLEARNYAQAWAMVHFLVHADDGRYRDLFDGFIADIAQRGLPWEPAFIRRFGRDLSGFENRFADWWLTMREDASSQLDAGATVQTLASFLARATAQKQRFDTAEAFMQAGREGTLRHHPQQWLPRSLLERALADAKTLGAWSLETAGGRPAIVLRRNEGDTIRGTFDLLSDGSVQTAISLEQPGSVTTTSRPSSPGGSP